MGVAGPILLEGRRAHRQLVLEGHSLREGEKFAWQVLPDEVAQVDDRGHLTARADGKARVRVTTPQGKVIQRDLVVSRSSVAASVSFEQSIVPIFTRYGCNGGGCHGKSGGQNGFRLSLLGFEPGEDYDHVVREVRGRRISPSAPESSLLLTKAAGLLPHGGGRRMEPGSDDFMRLADWIREGAPRGDTNAAPLERLEVFPRESTLGFQERTQLIVTAVFRDGRREDATRSALYESNEKSVAVVDELGEVGSLKQPGEAAVMVRYQGQVAVYRVMVPLGAPVPDLSSFTNLPDRLVARRWKEAGMPPSPVCDDATFLRRVTVDIAGRLPTLAEQSAFADLRRELGAGGAREQHVDRLLASPDYADFFANKWSALLRNRRTEARHARGTAAFHRWIRDQLDSNAPFDEWVRQVVSAKGDMSANPAVAWYRQVRTPGLQMEDVTQLFLGQRLQCAQCHHHPYERWSQKDYLGLTAFFSQVGYRPGENPGEEAVFHRRGMASVKNKRNQSDVRPAVLNGSEAKLSPDSDPREALADWMTRSENPWFARALVNRYWKHFFGRGLVEPEDDMRDTNPATHPELLDALAKDFRSSGHDLKKLVRTLVLSQVYQLSSIPNEYNAGDRQYFSRFYPRRLNAEVLYDAIRDVTGGTTEFAGLPPGTRAVCLPDNSFNGDNYFLTVFGRPESSSACECERSAEASLSQSLHLLNAPGIQALLVSPNSRLNKMAAKSSGWNLRLDELYRVALSRPPTSREWDVARSHLESDNTSEQSAWEDIAWALLNTKEFLFNH